MAKRCLIVSYYFPPMGGGGVQRMAKLVRYGSRAGWSFTVITADEKNSILAEDRSLSDDIPPTTKIIRVPAPAALAGLRFPFLKNAAYWQRWLSAFRFIPDIRRAWITPVREAINRELLSGQYDVVLLSAPPYSLVMLAAELTGSLPVPVIVDMRDPWTANPYKLHPTPLHLKKDATLERDSISRIRFGISAYQSLIGYYSEHIPHFDSSRWTVIPNGYDEADFEQLTPAQQQTDCFRLGFSGTFYSHINHPVYVFKALRQLRDIDPKAAGRLRFYHIGKSALDIKALAAKYGLQDIFESTGYLSHRECLSRLNTMDAFCFILDSGHRHSNKTIGGKVYEYLRLRKPILALVPETGEAARLINQTHSGTVVDPHDSRRAAEILHDWIQDPPDFSFKDIERYRRNKQAREFLNVFENAINTFPSNS